jgi:hypothetical protein
MTSGPHGREPGDGLPALAALSQPRFARLDVVGDEDHGLQSIARDSQTELDCVGEGRRGFGNICGHHSFDMA